ncbi:hypothetical protein FRC11_013359, partial [Ceratobasidium sp. 423]
AFKLCAVPEAEFNLAYDSLTSREAHQAILQLRTSNPQAYAEITSDGQLPIQPTEDPQAEVPDNGDHVSDIYDGDDEDEDGTVDELQAHIMRAESANDVARPLDEPSENVNPSPMLRRSARIGAARRQLAL